MGDPVGGPPRLPGGGVREKVGSGGPPVTRAPFHFVARHMGEADRAMPNTLDDPPAPARVRGPSPAKRRIYARYGHAKLIVNAPSRFEPTPPPAFRVRRPRPPAPLSAAEPDPITTPVFTTPRPKDLGSGARLHVHDPGAKNDPDGETCQHSHGASQGRAVRRRISLGEATPKRPRLGERSELVEENPAVVSNRIPFCVPASESKSEAGTSFKLSPGIFTQQPPLTVIACSDEDYPICAQSLPSAGEITTFKNCTGADGPPRFVAGTPPRQLGEGPDVRSSILCSRDSSSEVVDGDMFAPENELLNVALSGTPTLQQADDQESRQVVDAIPTKRSRHALTLCQDHLGSDSPIVYDTCRVRPLLEAGVSSRGLYSDQPALTLETVAPSRHSAAGSDPAFKAISHCLDDGIKGISSARNDGCELPSLLGNTPDDRSHYGGDKVKAMMNSSADKDEACISAKVRDGEEDMQKQTHRPHACGNQSVLNRSSGKPCGALIMPSPAVGEPSRYNAHDAETLNMPERPVSEGVNTNQAIFMHPPTRDSSRRGNKGDAETSARILSTSQHESNVDARQSQSPMSYIANLNAPSISPLPSSQPQTRVHATRSSLPKSDKSPPDGERKDTSLQTRPSHENSRTFHTAISYGASRLDICQSEQNWSDSVENNQGMSALESSSSRVQSATPGYGNSCLSRLIAPGLDSANLIDTWRPVSVRLAGNKSGDAAPSVRESYLFSGQLGADCSGGSSGCKSSESTDPPPDDDDVEMDLWRRRMAQRSQHNVAESEDSSDRYDSRIAVRVGYVATGLGDALSDEEGSTSSSGGRADASRVTFRVASATTGRSVLLEASPDIARNTVEEEMVDVCSNEKNVSSGMSRRVFEADASNERCGGEDSQKNSTGENGDSIFVSAIADLPVHVNHTATKSR